MDVTGKFSITNILSERPVQLSSSLDSLIVYEEAKDEDKKSDEEDEMNVRIPASIAEGQKQDLMRLIPEQHFTQPPPRYSEASLVQILEEYGIGRPSTYAPTLSTIQQRGYVERVDDDLFPPKPASWSMI